MMAAGPRSVFSRNWASVEWTGQFGQDDPSLLPGSIVAKKIQNHRFDGRPVVYHICFQRLKMAMTNLNPRIDPVRSQCPRPSIARI